MELTVPNAESAGISPRTEPHCRVLRSNTTANAGVDSAPTNSICRKPELTLSAFVVGTLPDVALGTLAPLAVGVVAAAVGGLVVTVCARRQQQAREPCIRAAGRHSHMPFAPERLENSS